MANLKNITDLPVAESADGLNLIVNDSGSAKQIPASAVGAQADWNETDESNPAFIKNKPNTAASWNDLTDKPFYEEEVTILEYVFTENEVSQPIPEGFLEIKKTYRAIIDGVEYNSTCYEEYGSGQALLDFQTPTVRISFGYPYYGATCYGMPEGSTCHIAFKDKNVHTLHEKFIPDSVKIGVYIIDLTSGVRWGDAAKEALLRGDTVYIYEGVNGYTLVTGFGLYQDGSGNKWIKVCSPVKYNGNGAFVGEVRTISHGVSSIEVG